MESHQFEVNLSWQYHRLGHLSAPGISETLEVATPPEFAKGMPGFWSPEHLWVAAVSSCFMTTFLAIAENSQLTFEDFDCQALGKVERVGNAHWISEIRLSPKLRLTHEADREKADRVLAKTEKACLITHFVRPQIVMCPRVLVDV